jgi:multiple sugar transport system substrate-binding protein
MRRKITMKKLNVLIALVMVASLLLAACTPPAAETAGPVPTDTEESVVDVTEPPAEPTLPPTPTPYPVADCQAGKVCVTWFVGLGTGTSPEQIAVQEEVVSDFNASQAEIQLILQVVPFNAARDALSTGIASGNAPDIVGPVGWGGSNDFYGQWLNIEPLITANNFDTSIFDPALVGSYQVEGEQVGLPFAVFPGGIYYVPTLFDEVGLKYPPTKYGDKYEMPDGTMVDWSWDTVTKISKLLTLDVNGKNSTEEGFDATNIVQVGYTPQFQSGNSIATFYGGPSLVYSGSAKGEYKAAIPDTWKGAWKWYYDGMWGKEPFIPTGPLSGSVEFGAGNVFNSGKAAMGLTQTWYTCCLGDLVKGGTEFQVGIQPMAADGVVHGRIDADTFRVWKGTKNPNEAFKVLAYLVTDGADKLLPVYGAMPAVASKTEAFFDKKKAEYPFVTQESWDVFVQGLAYPDQPSSESWMPNSIEGNARIATFVNLLTVTPPDQLDTGSSP